MITLDPAQDSRTGVYDDGLTTCHQCDQRVDPANMCTLNGNTDRCQDCAETECACVTCGDPHPYGELTTEGHCPPCVIDHHIWHPTLNAPTTL